MNFRHSLDDTPRVLIINPNTSRHVTQRIRTLIHGLALEDVVAEVASPAQGPIAIETERHKVEATRQVLALIERRKTEGFDGYIMACFDDIAIAQARALTQAPVISLAEAGMRYAAASGGSFTVITTFNEAVPTIEALGTAYGLGERCRVVATGMGVSDTVAQTEHAEERLHAAIQDAIHLHSEAIVLGSGAFAGRAKALQQRYGIVIHDGFAEALDYTRQRVQLAKG